MIKLIEAIVGLTTALTKYASDSKSRHNRAALHIAVRVKHLDELIGSLKKQKATKKIIKQIAAFKSKKKRLWKSFDKHIAAN